MNTVSEEPLYLCSGEEDVVRYVAHSAGDNTQSHSREYISVVPLPGKEGASVGQRHLLERTPAGKDASPLIKERGKKRRKKDLYNPKYKRTTK